MSTLVRSKDVPVIFQSSAYYRFRPLSWRMRPPARRDLQLPGQLEDATTVARHLAASGAPVKHKQEV